MHQHQHVLLPIEQLLIIAVAIALSVVRLNHEDAKRKLAADASSAGRAPFTTTMQRRTRLRAIFASAGDF